MGDFVLILHIVVKINIYSTLFISVSSMELEYCGSKKEHHSGVYNHLCPPLNYSFMVPERNSGTISEN